MEINGRVTRGGVSVGSGALLQVFLPRHQGGVALPAPTRCVLAPTTEDGE